MENLKIKGLISLEGRQSMPQAAKTFIFINACEGHKLKVSMYRGLLVLLKCQMNLYLSSEAKLQLIL